MIIDLVAKVLYGNDFEGQIPMEIRPVSGKKGMKILDGAPVINLDRIAEATDWFYP